MSKKYIFAFFILIALVIIFIFLIVLANNIAVLNPKGVIALKERNLIIFALLLSLVVVVPVFVLTFIFAWKFRENRQERYEPDWNHNFLIQIASWTIPAAIIVVLATVTWIGTHALDPYKPIEASAKPIEIQVVALRWKWLFIYPQQNIATVNFIEFPVNTPLNFELTADAPMNSFWIPQLGGQMYAMAGMRTQLHLMADKTGEFAGSAAEINGEGFAGMRFTAKASSPEVFDNWVQSVKSSSQILSYDEYNNLAQPSEYNPVSFYSSADKGLFDRVVAKYMMPAAPASRGEPAGRQ